jgi:hypothetical protein
MILDLDNLSIKQTIELSSFKSEAHTLLVEIHDLIFSQDQSLFTKISVFGTRDPHQNKTYNRLLFFLWIKSNKEKITRVISKDYLLIKLINESLELPVERTKISQQTRFKVFLRPLSSLFMLLLQFRLGLKLKKTISKTTKVETIVEINVVESMFQNNAIEDRYYTGFQNFLSEDENNRIANLPQFLFSKENFKSVSKKVDDTDFSSSIIKEKYLTIIDYLWVIKKVIFSKLNTNNIFDNKPIKNFIELSFNEHRYSYSNFLSLLNYRFAYKYSLKNNPKTLIDWFENQATDKGLNLGFHNFIPKCHRKGYQSFIMDRDYNSHLSVTDQDLKFQTVPNVICLTGSAFQKQAFKYSNKVILNTVPAFRFSHLHNCKPREGSYIVVFLPFNIDQSNIMLREILILANQLPKQDIIVKFHPSYTGSRGLASNIKESLLPTKELLSQSNLIISSNSSVCLEAIIYKSPLIIFGFRNNVFQSLVPSEFNDSFFVHWESENLEEAVSKTLQKILQKDSFPTAEYFLKATPELTKNLFFGKII